MHDQPTKLFTDKASSPIHWSLRIHSSQLGTQWEDHDLSTPNQPLPPLQERRLGGATQKNREIGKEGNLIVNSKQRVDDSRPRKDE